MTHHDPTIRRDALDINKCPSVWTGAGPTSRCELDDTIEAHTKALGLHDGGLTCHRQATSNGVATWGITDDDRARWAESR